MKNGLFITTVNLYSNNAMTSGIIKKIFNQVTSLNIETKLSCKPFILPKPNNRILLYFSFLFFNIYKNITIIPNKYDFIYIIRTLQTISQYLNLIVVAQFAPWHGYDRLIEGIKDYYSKETTKKVYVHFVGSEEQINIYKKLVKYYHLSEYIFFHGPLFGKQLTDMFNNSDIAICGLGGHRKSIYLSSELKSREYLARGIPMISSTKIDILPDDFIYCLYVPSDDSPINIKII